MKHKVCFRTGSGQFGTIKLVQTGIDRFAVWYGLQLKAGLNYSEAAHELGACIMHAAACNSKLDNRERGER